jgi:hypothetical protein
MLTDAVAQLLQGFLPEYFSRLGVIGADGLGRQEDHPTGFHIGFQFLALHSIFLLFVYAFSHCSPGKRGKTHERGKASPKTARHFSPPGMSALRHDFP